MLNEETNPLPKAWLEFGTEFFAGYFQILDETVLEKKIPPLLM